MNRIRHWLWRLTRRHHADLCDGSPFRLCETCLTPEWCRRSL